jgi:hypothetical protein
MTQTGYTDLGPNLDNIVFEGGSLNWLGRHGLLPSKWGLPEQEAARILQAQIRLYVFNSPVFVLDLRPNEFGLVFGGYLVSFNAALLKHTKEELEKLAAAGRKLSGFEVGMGVLNREEVIAVFLHEIGHKVNVFQSAFRRGSAERIAEDRERGPYAGEHDADDYAGHCGFGGQLADALHNLAHSGRPLFDTHVTYERVKRLRDRTEFRPHFRTS